MFVPSGDTPPTTTSDESLVPTARRNTSSARNSTPTDGDVTANNEITPDPVISVRSTEPGDQQHADNRDLLSNPALTDSGPSSRQTTVYDDGDYVPAFDPSNDPRDTGVGDNGSDSHNTHNFFDTEPPPADSPEVFVRDSIAAAIAMRRRLQHSVIVQRLEHILLHDHSRDELEQAVSIQLGLLGDRTPMYNERSDSMRLVGEIIQSFGSEEEQEPVREIFGMMHDMDVQQAREEGELHSELADLVRRED